MKGLDYPLIITVGFLILLGLVILTSVSAAISQEKFGSPNFYIFHHIIFGLLPGTVLGFIAFKIPLSSLKKWSPVLLLLNLILLVLVFVPKVGMALGGAKSWINVFGITSFQPSEFLKLSFTLYLASWLAVRIGKSEKSFNRTFFAFSAAIGLVCLLLILQPDIGTLGIIILTALLIYFLSGAPVKHGLIIASAIVVGFAILIKLAPYRLSRILVFINPDIDPMGLGYQLKQSLIAVGSGGIFGKGLGSSAQTFVYLPQRIGDSIFALFAEETGFVGAVILIALFLIFAWRAFSIAKNAQDKFCQLTALGVTLWITLQAFVNIGSMVGLLPLTGIPLPFISYGGSALVAELIGVGLLLNIAKNV